jgi:peroxiredoxin
MNLLLIISSVLLWAIVLFNLLITFQLIRVAAPGVWEKSSPGLRVGQQAPVVNLKSINGEVVALSSFLGSRFMLIFIAPDCALCTERIPEIQALRPLSVQTGVQMIFVCKGDREAALKVADEFEISLPLFFAHSSDSIWTDYKISGTPFFCLVDQNLQIVDLGLFDSRWAALINGWKARGRIGVDIQQLQTAD